MKTKIQFYEVMTLEHFCEYLHDCYLGSQEGIRNGGNSTKPYEFVTSADKLKKYFPVFCLM